MKKVVIYVRVSTREQAEEGYSIGAQIEKLRKYCEIKGWIVVEEYVDAGFSGGSLKRPAMERLIRDVKKGKFDMVLVYKLDRLSRSQKDTLYLIEEVFKKNAIDFTSMQENFDTSTPLGMAMVGILSVFAQLERAQIAERMAMGREARAQEGLWHGGGFDPIGYDYIKGNGEKGGGQLVINEYEAMQVRKIYDMFESGCSVHEIQQFMSSKYKYKHGSWKSDSAVRSVLETPVVCGMIKTKDGYVDGQHDAIIDLDRFERVQKELAKRRSQMTASQKNPFKRTSLLGGLLFCGNCGARYYLKCCNSGRKPESKKLIRYYTCYSRGKSSKKMIMDPNCKNISVADYKLDKVVIDQILQLQLEPDQIDEIPDQIDDTLIIREKIEDLEAKRKKLMDLYLIDAFSIDELQEKVDQINAEIDALEDELVFESKPLITIEDAKKKISNASEIFETGSFEEKSAIIHYLIDQIFVYDDHLEIHWNFE